MGTFILNIDASSVFTTDAPVLEILVGGVVVSSLTIDSTFTNSSLSFNFTGNYPSSLSIRFNDNSLEGGRSVTLNNVTLNGTNIDGHLSSLLLNKNDVSTVNVVATETLFGITEKTISDLGTITHQGDTAMNKLVGTTGVDVIDGADNNDNINGNDGNDQINGGEGNDLIRGGAGHDLIIGAGGNDLLLGEDGNDEIYGGAGNDNIQGEAGNDTINAGDDNDVVRGGLGNDVIFGGAGNDNLKGEDNDDVIVGGAGMDLLEGGTGNDSLSGGDDNDTLRGEDGNDSMFGDDGFDRLFGDAGQDVLHGGEGNDLLEGGADNDQLYGDAGLDLLRGGDGDDTLDGGADNDQLYGDTGNDTIDGGSGLDRIEGGDGNDILRGGSDNDTVLGDAGVDYVYGDDGHDRVRGGDGDDFVYGGDGNDQVFGDLGNDQVWGGAGNDLVNGNEGDDLLYGESGLDKIFGHEGNDTVHGGNDNDRIYGNEGNDILNGDDGNDILYASSEHETVTTYIPKNVLLYTQNFSSNTGGFAYADGGFGGTDPGNNNASGSRITTDGNAANGALSVVLDGDSNSTENNISGNWSRTITLTEDTSNTNLTLSYRLWHASANDTGEDVTAYVEVNGVRYGLNGNDYINKALGSGGTTDTGWVTVSLDLGDLSAGNHTIRMGAIKNTKNRNDEDSYIRFDDISLSGDQDVDYTGLKIMDEGTVNILNGGAGADTLYGSSGNDTLNGGTGNDVLYSGTTTSLQDVVDDILAANSGVVYNETTGSFYKYVDSTLTWSAANTSALSSTLVGMSGVNGHLVTITSLTEQNYVWSLTGNNSVWGGGSDSAVEGAWRWSGGPENGNQFWSGNQTGSATNGYYNNWIPGQEPWAGSADYDYFILRSQNGGQWYTENSTVTYRYIVEWEATTLIDSIGKNILNGGDGADDLYGSTGADIFLFDNTSNVDDIFGFSAPAGDAIDIGDILSYNPATHAISNFVQLTTASGNTNIAVDVDGTANGVNFVNIASIQGVTGLNLNTMVADGSLIVV